MRRERKVINKNEHIQKLNECRKNIKTTSEFFSTAIDVRNNRNEAVVT